MAGVEPLHLAVERGVLPAEGLIDRLVNARLRELQFVPSDVCDDATFIRRVTLDLTGLLPTPEEVEGWFRLFHLYFRESPEDGGILLAASGDFAADLDDTDDVVAGPGDGDAGGLDLVDARVRGVECSRDLVEADLALYRGSKIVLEGSANV